MAEKFLKVDGADFLRATRRRAWRVLKQNFDSDLHHRFRSRLFTELGPVTELHRLLEDNLEDRRLEVIFNGC